MKYRYPGIQPFSRADEGLFFGRDTDADRLYKLLRLEQLVVLYGKSGYGKSSLLQAKVLPRMERDTDFLTVTVRFYAKSKKEAGAESLSPVLRVARTLEDLLPDDAPQTHFLDQLLPGEDSIWYHLKKVQAATGRRRILLVFDQFEEIFTYDEREILPFRAQLADVLYAGIPQNFRNAYDRLADEGQTPLSDADTDLYFSDLEVKAMFSIRSDFMHLLNRLKDYLPQTLRHCYELEALSAEGARQAIEEPAKGEKPDFSPPFAYDASALSLLLHYLTNGGKEKIESFQLQLICRHVEDELVLKKQDYRIEATDFGDSRDAQLLQLRNVNRNYYETCIHRLPEGSRKAARLIIEDELISEEDQRRITADGGRLVSRYRAVGATPELLAALRDTYLLRAEASRDSVYYELCHDAMVVPVLTARTERREAERIETERLEAEQQALEEATQREAERLEAERKAAEEAAERHRLREEARIEKERRQEQERLRIRAVWWGRAAALAAAGALVLAFLALKFQQKAKGEAERAEKESKAAADSRDSLTFEKQVNYNFLLDQAHNYMGKNDYESALGLLQTALRFKPGAADVLHALDICTVQLAKKSAYDRSLAAGDQLQSSGVEHLAEAWAQYQAARATGYGTDKKEIDDRIARLSDNMRTAFWHFKRRGDIFFEAPQGCSDAVENYQMCQTLVRLANLRGFERQLRQIEENVRRCSGQR